MDKLAVRNLFFSEGTYQVEIWDPKANEAYWPFLQIDDQGKILDCFCTCQEAEQKGSCVHMRAAFEKVARPRPLHIRFRTSLWNQICQIASRRHGFQSKALQKKPDGSYEAYSITGKLLLQIIPKSAAMQTKLDEIIRHEIVETEETSLKFSRLSAEELLLWKQGRPSRRFQYELSFWSDLAKWWMLMQEEGAPYKISFSGDNDSLPKGITIEFPDFQIRFYIAEVNWNRMIPALANVNSPLKVFEIPGKNIQDMTYDAQNKKFVLTYGAFAGKEAKVASAKSISVGDYEFVPEVGFYPGQKDPIFDQSEITQEKIPYFLKRYSALVQEHLSNTTLHDTFVSPSYQIAFLPDKGLEIAVYVFEKGDLQKPTSAFFSPWIYLEGRGFYLLEDLHFEQPYFIVPKAEMADFVERHRFWLHQFEGFQIQVSNIESKVSYQVNDKGLYFDAVFDGMEEAEEIIDLGRFLYVKGRGFYSKSASRVESVRPGMFIPAKEIARFIRDNREELGSMMGFFDSVCPLEKVGLKIRLNEQGNITVSPEYLYTEQGQGVRIFGEYTYTPNRGFAEIPLALRLPEMYWEEIIITRDYEPYFLGYDIQMLRPFIIEIDPRLEKPIELRLQVKKMTQQTRGEWALELQYESELGEVPVYDVWKAVSENKRYLFSKAGMLSLQLPRFHWLKEINKKSFATKGKQLQLSSMEWMRLSAFETMHFQDDPKEAEDFLSFSTPQLPSIEDLQTTLRSYQEKGVHWLWFLFANGLSGFLCDEMGLGKTHQTMGLLAAIRASKKSISALVVCPTSVMFHWQKLLEKFLPNFKVSLFHGPQRSITDKPEVLLTSYGMIRTEVEFFRKQHFDIVVFDEIQAAKNVKSQIHRALKTLSADMKLGLTGTPIENTLLELKALFDLVVPSYMPGDSTFRELFLQPIEKNSDVERKQLLGRIIKPFILRRKKSEVLLELPEKTEEIAYCELSPEQNEMYQQAYNLSRSALLTQLHDSDKPIPYVHIFALLTALKRICDHPCMVTKNIQDYAKHASGKWDLFVELLQEARESKQKIVVFSQYLDMLDIIELYLSQNQIGFAKIRGSTKDRMEQVERFRVDPQCEVFVASLQAAGVGIDLVSASVVIHYDRWWNPAKENQATDRVHRIGQNRGVQVFKLVTKNTIEESIHQLIERKQGLFETVVGYDDHLELKSLRRDDLLEILQITNIKK